MQHGLYYGDDRFAWHGWQWPQFQEIDGSKALVVLPVYSLMDWGMERPLDAEELVGSILLNEALKRNSGEMTPLVLPPFRFTPKLSAATCFGMDIEEAHEALEETICSAARSGLTRFVLFNTSPLLEEWIDVAGRDLRVKHDLQMFCLNLSGVGLDFHPERGGDRSALQSILTEATGVRVKAFTVERAHSSAIDPMPEALVHTCAPLAGEDFVAGSVIERCALHLASLLEEITNHPALRLHELNAEETE